MEDFYNKENEEVIELVKELYQKYKVDLRNRIFDFVVRLMKFLMLLPKAKEFDVFRYQLSKAGTSIGANYEESQASSLKEFVQKNRIALREAKETEYFLRIIEALGIHKNEECKILIKEAHEISLILGSIVSKTDRRMKENS